MSTRAAVAAAALLAALVAGGCTVGGDGKGAASGPSRTDPSARPAPTEPVSPLAECADLTTPPPAAGPRAGRQAGDGAAPALPDRLPDLTLPCVTGGEPVALGRLAGPAVVNLWASWCAPCRDELPALQRFADRTVGRVHVVGVVTEDTRTRAVWLARDTGVTFPAVHDVEGRLLDRLPAVGLPLTLFVDAEGRVRHLHNAPLDDRTLAALATEHLGVVLP
ncbi:MAG TPA: TlpA disulfide reductase family protein [Natronosporangium sp.]|nr:TlpA disulfide reductase family protein [Natronosporangium sp.]